MHNSAYFLGFLLAAALASTAACSGGDSRATDGDASSYCSDGTVAVGGVCKGRVTCGQGTIESSGQCLAEVICGEGTEALAGRCVPSESAANCGTGTILVGDKCYVDASACKAGSRWENGACVGEGGAPVSCGTDTRLSNGRCIGTVLCGAGTSRTGDECQASSAACGANTTFTGGQCVGQAGSSLSCGPNTIQSGGRCVLGAGACGVGTTLSGSQCVDASPNVTCGTGTTLQNGQCVAPSVVSCGPGTVLSGNQCVPAPPATDIPTFAARTDLNGAYEEHRTTVQEQSVSYEVCITPEASISTASRAQQDGFLRSGGAIIGNQELISIRTYDEACTHTTFGPMGSFTVTQTIKPRTTCTPETAAARASLGSYVTYSVWSGAAVTRAVCATAGSILFTANASARTMTVTLNAQFSDGSAVTDKSWTVPWTP